jgi:predicted transport protein
MAIFKIEKNKLSPVKEKKINLEKEIQKITEENLETIFGLKFVSSEFSLQNFRIDTLAFDEETNSFVIIEYKRERSFSVVDQGFSYLSLMLNNKSDFILEFNEKTNKNLKRNDVDWSQSKVVFLANSFTTYQQNAINFKDLPIELWEVEKYDDGLILYNQLKSSNSSESINTISKSKTIENVSKEVKRYSVEDHFKKGYESEDIYEALRDQIFNIDNKFQEVPTKVYIGFKIGTNVLFAVNVRKTKLEIHLYRIRPDDIKDPQNKLEHINNSMKYWNKHVSRFFVKSLDDINYSVYLIKEAYKNLVDNNYKK